MAAAARFHQFDPAQWFGGSYEDGRTHATRLARDVEAIRCPVDQIDVGVAAAQEHGAIARRLAPKRVRSGIPGDVRFRFDDPDDGTTVAAVGDEQCTEQKARKCAGFSGQLRPA